MKDFVCVSLKSCLKKRRAELKKERREGEFCFCRLRAGQRLAIKKFSQPSSHCILFLLWKPRYCEAQVGPHGGRSGWYPIVLNQKKVKRGGSLIAEGLRRAHLPRLTPSKESR